MHQSSLKWFDLFLINILLGLVHFSQRWKNHDKKRPGRNRYILYLLKCNKIILFVLILNLTACNFEVFNLEYSIHYLNSNLNVIKFAKTFPSSALYYRCRGWERESK